MQTRETTTLEISSAADLDEMVQHLSEFAGEHVVVSVLDESDALLTAAEFSRVVTAARAVNVSLAIETEDRLRRELARMLGWAVVSPNSAPQNESTQSEAEHDDATEEVSFDDQPGNTTADLASYVPMRSRRPATAASPGERPATPQVGPEAPRAAIAATTPTQPVPARTRPTREAAESIETEATAAKPRRRRRRGLLLVGAIAAPLAMLAVVAGLLVYILPTARVTLVPRQSSIQSSLTYGVALPGASYDISIQPSDLSHLTTFAKTIPTTGERFVPDATAAGSVLFTNAQTRAITVPAGTQLKGANGVTYVTAEEVSVPKADPFGTLSFGSITAHVTAAVPGLDGNIEAGQVAGQLDSGIFYTNREAIAGGTRKRIAVVSEADIATLEHMAKDDLTARTEPEFLATVPTNMTLVPDSVTLENQTIEFSQKAGTDGTEVSVRASQQASGQIYDPSKLHAQAKDEAGRRLTSNAQPDVILLGDSVQISDPEPAGNSTSWRIEAHATVRSVITDEEQQTVVRELVGKSRGDGEQILASMPDVADYRLQLEPSWLPERLPEIASRISVEVASELPPADR